MFLFENYNNETLEKHMQDVLFEFSWKWNLMGKLRGGSLRDGRWKKGSEKTKMKKGGRDIRGELLSRVSLWATEEQFNWVPSEELCNTALKIVLS